MENEKRKFERHNLAIPIIIQLGDVVYDDKEYLHDISLGGLSFKSLSYIKKGTIIDIKIPLIKPIFEAKGKIIRCRKEKKYYIVGIRFIEVPDAFRLRMVEQICLIENYKKEAQKREGRKLTGEEAALEWIYKYAKYFPHFRKDRNNC